MRPLSLLLLLVGVGCSVRVSRPPPRVAISVKGAVRAQVRTELPAEVRTETATEVRTETEVHTEAPAEVRIEPPAPAVAIEGAPIVEFFGIPLEGAQDVVFVLDCSGSMDDAAQGAIAQVGTAPAPDAQPGADPAQASEPAAPEAPPPPVHRKIDVAQAELVHALEQLPAGTRMNVLFFDSDVEGFAGTLVELEEPSRADLIAYVKEQSPTGRTALVPAMRTAFLMNARRIVLLSDGLGNVGGNSATLLRDAREAIRGGVRIDTVGIGTDHDVDLLQTLARDSGGLYQGL